MMEVFGPLFHDITLQKVLETALVVLDETEYQKVIFKHIKQYFGEERL
jgi:hypothetical protein